MKMKRIIRFLVLTLLCFRAVDGSSFTVIFKDGMRIEGTWVAESPDTIQIKDAKGIIRTYNKSLLDTKAMTTASRMPLQRGKPERSTSIPAPLLRGIELEDNVVRLIGDGTLEFNSFELASPHRLVIDFRSLSLAPDIRKAITSESPLYWSVRLSQFDSDPRTVRAVIDLRRKVPFQLISEGNSLRVQLGPALQKSDKLQATNEVAAVSTLLPPDVPPAPTPPPEAERQPVDTSESTGATTSPGPIQPAQIQPVPVPRISRKRWSLEADFYNVYESNVDHDADNIVDSVGVVYALNTRFRNRPSNPSFLLGYEIGRHQYTNTDKWDRVSHNFKATYLLYFGKKFVLETNGEISLKGSSEDRELGDQYVFKPVLNFYVNRSTQLELVAAHRNRKFETGSDAVNRYVGAGLKKEFGNHEIGAYYRYEYNDSENPRSDRYISTYDLRYTMPLTKDSWASIKVQNRATRYVRRYVEIDVDHGPDIQLYLREDNKWNLKAALGIPAGKKFEIVPAYEFETRTSNDPEKEYNAYAFSVSIVYKFW